MSLLSHPRQVTISIVSHGHVELIAPLLRQLETHCLPLIAQVIITFNIPEDDTRLPATRLPLLKRMNPQPLGFGCNHNRAFADCHSPWFLVLNPDVTITSDVLTPLLEQAQPRHGLLATQVLEPGQSAAVAERGLLSPLEILRRHWGHVAPAPETCWVAGLFMLLRRQAFEAVGGFDEKFHMYCEDFDLCARLRLAGWQIHRARQLTIGHDARRASHVKLQHLVWHLHSLLRLWLSPVWWQYRRLLRQPRP